jgi:protocatechuate 3,4-dioxygenase beta subunit
MAPSEAKGEPLTIVAAVLDAACNPAQGASVHVWHTDSRGLYRPPGTEQCCFYQGDVRTDARGRFRMDGVRPAQYPVPGAPPAHIHLEIRHASGGLNAEIQFADRTATPGPIQSSDLVYITLRRNPDGTWYGETAFVLMP